MRRTIRHQHLRRTHSRVALVHQHNLTISPRSTITHNQLIHRDFDNDGVPNIDDRYPFNPNRDQRVNDEVSLSKTLLDLERKRRAAHNIARRFSKEHGMTYRIKHPYSVVGKAVKNYPQKGGDFIGFRKESTKRRQSAAQWNAFNQKHKDKIVETDNKYVTNKGTPNPYRAYHTNIKLRGFGAEAQFRTRKFGELNDTSHTPYKKGEDISAFHKKSKELIKKGY